MRKPFSVVLIGLMITCSFSTSNLFTATASYSGSFEFLNHIEGSEHYRLNVAVSQALLDYYQTKTRGMDSSADFAKFVTPYALKPIADSVGQVCNDDEDFVNCVLMIVHQIPYEVTVASKYPAETIADNRGDCDLFSYVAASITKAQGLDTVLVYYENEAHMNIAVRLSHMPDDARGTVSYVTSNNEKYYIAECTGGNWQTGWRVGELPDTLNGASFQVLTLENSEQTAPGQVAASYETLQGASMSLSLSSTFAVQGSLVMLYGILSPALADRNITVYASINGSPWAAIGSTTTDYRGEFEFAWVAEAPGVAYLRASWSGGEVYAGADSSVQTVTTLSTFLVALIAVMVILGILGIFLFLTSQRVKNETTAAQII